jgi:hypothetical protein
MLENRVTAVAKPTSAQALGIELAKRRRIKWMSKATNDPLHRANGNTSQGRRVRDLYQAFMEDMGNPTGALAQANCLTAAELKTAAEVARAAFLAGTGDAEQLIRLENLAARAKRKLGIRSRARRRPCRFANA